MCRVKERAILLVIGSLPDSVEEKFQAERRGFSAPVLIEPNETDSVV